MSERLYAFSKCILESKELCPLVLYFHDYDKPQKDVILMSENDVKKIIEFLKEKGFDEIDKVSNLYAWELYKLIKIAMKE